ncbi:hypothetical protein TRVL_01468 [Trypanosoma vivax]|uniref:Uncharacterized protein n=1 Tax=Trypanosoma vivax (strain Y486) TaxID=1055687 RepID=G0U7L6_TRYVY|nr:hypothetical protein TRVL_01468 [Trypanosoma vivax]CCC51874.1 hypothetical protein TVY486_1009190 [Trypanosoma vivax Y486]
MCFIHHTFSASGVHAPRPCAPVSTGDHGNGWLVRPSCWSFPHSTFIDRNTILLRANALTFIIMVASVVIAASAAVNIVDGDDVIGATALWPFHVIQVHILFYLPPFLTH